MASFSSPFPLEVVWDSHLRKLCQIFWSWQLCSSCEMGHSCTTSHCPWQRSKRLARYFEYYKKITASYVPDLLPGSQPALRSHEDVFDIIRLLKAQPDVPRSQLTRDYFAGRGEGPLPTPEDQDRAFSLAVRAMTIVNCSGRHESSDLLELGALSVPWRHDVSLSQFMQDTFPMTAHLGDSWDIKGTSAAIHLKKRAGLQFQPTDDLRSHLKLDRRRGVVEIYYHTAFLKENLIVTRSANCTTMSESIKLGNIPRQLALETLDSLQKILFPSDSESKALLRSLVSKGSFDPNCLRFESASNRTNDEREIEYRYFGARLADLYEEIENPGPRSLVERWFERRSGASARIFAIIKCLCDIVILDDFKTALDRMRSYWLQRCLTGTDSTLSSMLLDESMSMSMFSHGLPRMSSEQSLNHNEKSECEPYLIRIPKSVTAEDIRRSR
ncbi:hypothetical protein VTN77DRAFT_7313 [Rasamsonia byssochlamydoides]|uniref:uncharacterized protein n=1 Tax=Rasamsonia byssochlamydoides TaxID=89139 RepID=UPI0037423FB0